MMNRKQLERTTLNNVKIMLLNNYFFKIVMLFIMILISITLAVSNIYAQNEKKSSEYSEYHKSAEIVEHQMQEYFIDESGKVSLKKQQSNNKTPVKQKSSSIVLPAEFGNIQKDVHDQGNSPTCWAFSSVSLFEYAVDKKMNVNTTTFSAEHMTEKLSIVGNCGFQRNIKRGLDTWYTAGYYAAGYGPVNSADYPWLSNEQLIEDYDFGRSEYRATEIEKFEDKTDLENPLSDETNRKIKEAVYNNGAVVCHIYTGNWAFYQYLGSDNKSFYLPNGGLGIDHAVLIVGWNDNWERDNFRTDPGSEGAWLVRNSWGTDFGDNGYYWVSYKDLSINPRYTIRDYEKMDSSTKVYNLDESGSGTIVGSGAKEQGFINVFDIEDEERLTEVTFYNECIGGTCLAYYVPIDEDGVPNVSEKKLISDSKTIDYKGYHTLKINQEIKIPSNTKCGIMVYIKNESGTSIGLETTQKEQPDKDKPPIVLIQGTVKPGESYFCTSSGELTDVTTYGEGWCDFSIKLVTEQYDIPISACEVEAITNRRYNGNKKKPTPEITYNGIALTQGKDYTLSYENNVYAGTATVIITGIGNYTGTRRVNFTILKAKFAEAVISDIGIQCYTGSEIHPTYTVTFNNNKLTLKENVDYTVSYVNCTNAGTATLKLTGKGNYSGTKSVNFTISPANISSTYVYGNPTPYTGSGIIYKPTIKYNDITLKEGIDYTISYSNNINAGKSPMTITGINNFTGTRYVNFIINPADISNATISNIKTQGYSGSAETPKPTITFNNMTLKEGTDYTLSYSNNVDVGWATITITGIGNFTGTTTKTFEISNGLQYAKIYIPDGIYDEVNGTFVRPTPVVLMGSKTLVEHVDYIADISPANVDGFGTYHMYITGIGKYTTTVIYQFNVVPANSANSATFSNKQTNIAFKQVHKPTVEIDGKTLVEGIDYDAYFVGNIYVEMPLDTITEINNFTTMQPDIFDVDIDEKVDNFE